MPGSLFMGIIGSLLVGVVSAGAVIFLLDRFTPMLTSQTLLPGLGVGGAALVATLLATLRVPKLVEIDDHVLRLTPYVGVPREYDRAQCRFGAFLTYSNNQVRSRAVSITTPDGSEQRVGLALEPATFDAMMRVLTGQQQVLGAAAQSAGYAPHQQYGAPSGPLVFEPQTFSVRKAAQLTAAWVMLALGFAFGLALAALLAYAEAPAAAYLIAAAVLALFVGIAVWFFRAAARIPATITVTPLGVTFGDRSFAYHDIYALELPAPGLGRTASVKIMTTDSVKTIIPLTQGNPKAFARYDEFAELLLHAANAVKPVASFSYSGQ